MRAQAAAIFTALRRSGISYVSSIFTFGNYAGETERIRLPRETLELSNANCIDVSVAYASALENLMKPVIIICSGRAFTGVRLGPNSQEFLYLDLTVLPHGTFAAAIARAQAWLKKTPPNEVLTVDIGAARALGVYPMPVSGAKNKKYCCKIMDALIIGGGIAGLTAARHLTEAGFASRCLRRGSALAGAFTRNRPGNFLWNWARNFSWAS